MTRTFSVRDAVDRYLKERRKELSDSTLTNHRALLEYFIEFCTDNGIETTQEIDPFDISDFRLHRSELVSEETVYNNLTTLRTFISWCEGRGIIENGIADNMIMPDITGGSRNTTLPVDRIKDILSYMETYEYATFEHALFILMWDTGLRRGAIRSIDVDNFNEEEKYVAIRHNPEQDTPLKNGKKSERNVNINSGTAQVISDYIEARRKQTKDDYGNDPLFSTERGRAHVSTITKRIASITRPCYHSNQCPHDREIETCEANNFDGAAKCPSSVSPHPIRRSAITHFLDEGYSKELLSERNDVSVKVLEDHYDARSKEDKRELRRELLDIK